MIRLTRLTRGPFLVNPDLIEHVEVTPDTVVTLTNGHQFVVLETAEEVLERVIAFRRAIQPPYILNPSSEEAPETAGGAAPA